MKKHKGIIYKAISPSNKIYVGQTKVGLEKRKQTHFNSSKNCSYKFANAIKKYGIDGLYWEIVFQNVPEEYLDALEILMISYYNSHIKGYNCDKGGTGARGRKCTDETRKKLSDAHKGSNNFMYGKHHTEETKEKISKAHEGKFVGEKNPMYGKHHTEETKNKISENLKGKMAGKDHPMYGKHHTEETKNKISKSMGGENNPNYNIKLSDKTKERISSSKKGQKHSEETKRKMSESKKNRKKLTQEQADDIVKKFISGNFTQIALAKEYKVARKTIRMVINKTHKIYQNNK